jgi:hypothetical protein
MTGHNPISVSPKPRINVSHCLRTDQIGFLQRRTNTIGNIPVIDIRSKVYFSCAKLIFCPFEKISIGGKTTFEANIAEDLLSSK